MIARLGLVAVVLMLSSFARAQPAQQSTQPSGDPSAASLLREANERHAVADFQGAVVLLQRAILSEPSPAIRAQVHLFLGINHEVLGDMDDARRAFRSALFDDPTLRIDPRRFRSLAVSLFREVRAALSGTIEIDAGADVKVEIDGTGFGSGKIKRQVSIGVHEVRLLSAEGKQLLKRSVIVAPDAIARIKQPLPTASRPLLTTAKEPPRRRFWTWLAIGGAAATLGIATGFAVASESDYDDWEAEWKDGGDELRWNDLESAGKRKELVANVLFVTAGALAVTSAVLFFLEGRRSEKPPRRAAVSVAAGCTNLVVSF